MFTLAVVGWGGGLRACVLGGAARRRASRLITDIATSGILIRAANTEVGHR